MNNSDWRFFVKFWTSGDSQIQRKTQLPHKHQARNFHAKYRNRTQGKYSYIQGNWNIDRGKFSRVFNLWVPRILEFRKKRTVHYNQGNWNVGSRSEVEGEWITKFPGIGFGIFQKYTTFFQYVFWNAVKIFVQYSERTIEEN